ncbi:MAG: hypothetical protein ACP5D9_07460 [Mariniphaga sp.]
MGTWKDIHLQVQHNADRPLELYNLEKDIAETLDVSEKYPEIWKRTLEIMKEEHELSEHFPILQKEY